MDRRELKREYKAARPSMGVYRVHNKVDDRSLVGSSTNLPAILNRHQAQLRMGVHLTPGLQGDWNDRGADAFAFEILDTLEASEDPSYDPAADLRELEKLWLEKLNPFDDRGYNRRPK